MDKLNSIRIFCRIAELGSFVAVAKEANLSAMMISKHVANLEKNLSVSLLNRTTRKVSLTEAGANYYQRGKQILEELSELDDQVSKLGQTVKGTLRISAPIDFGGMQLAPVIAEYQHLYPEVSLMLVLDNGSVNLTDGSYDLAIRVTDTLNPGLVARKITSTPLALYASPEYIRRNGCPQTIDGLRNHQCLHYLDTPHGDYWLFSVQGKQKKIRLQWHFASNNGRVLGLTAELGMGIVQAPELSVSSFLEKGSLIEIMADCKPSDLAIYAVYPQRKFIPAKLATFVDFMIAYFGKDNTKSL